MIKKELTILYNTLYLYGFLKDNNGTNSKLIYRAIETIDKLQKENVELKLENDDLRFKYSTFYTKICQKRNNLLDKYSTKFVDNKSIYIAMDIINEILNDSEVKKWQQ